MIEFLSKLRPETSLINFTPSLIPFSMISDFLVSRDIKFFLSINFKIFLSLFHSIFDFIALDPGLVDSAPISTRFEPEFKRKFNCFLADA